MPYNKPYLETKDLCIPTDDLSRQAAKINMTSKLVEILIWWRWRPFLESKQNEYDYVFSNRGVVVVNRADFLKDGSFVGMVFHYAIIIQMIQISILELAGFYEVLKKYKKVPHITRQCSWECSSFLTFFLIQTFRDICKV